MESLELCTHWVMECFVTIHYTARAFYVLGISIWGLGILNMQSKTMFYFSISMSSDAGLADRLMRWRVQYLLVRSMGWTYIHRPLRSTRSDPDDNIFDFLGFNSMWAEDGSADADIRAVHIVRVNWLRMGGLQFRSLADFQNYLAQQVWRQLQINRLRLLLPWQWGRAYREVRKGGGGE